MQLVIIFVRVVVEEMAGQLNFLAHFFAHQEDKAIKDRKNVRLPNKRGFNY